MFDFAWSEIALIGVVALIAIGPKDMPVAIKAVSEVIKKARRMAGEFQTHVDEMVREADLGEVRDQINQIRSFDLKGVIKRTIDEDGSLERTLTEDPFATTSASTGVTAHHDPGRAGRRCAGGDPPGSHRRTDPPEPRPPPGSRGARLHPARGRAPAAARRRPSSRPRSCRRHRGPRRSSDPAKDLPVSPRDVNQPERRSDQRQADAAARAPGRAAPAAAVVDRRVPDRVLRLLPLLRADLLCSSPSRWPRSCASAARSRT